MVIDIICFLFAAYGFYLGYTKGIIKTVFTIIAIFFGLIAAFKFGPMVTSFLESLLNYSNGLMFLVGMLVSFGLSMLVIKMLASGFEGLLKSANINILNKALGGAVMSGLLVSVFSVLVLFGDKSHVIDDDTKYESKTYSFLEAMPDMMLDGGKKLKPFFSEFWDYSVDFMDKLEKGSKKNFEKTDKNVLYDYDDNGNRTRRN